MKYSPRKAIQVKCKDCSCGSLLEVQKCTVTDCALWPYRWGKPDFRNAKFPPKFWPKATGRKMSEGHKALLKAKLVEYRAKRA